MYVFLCNIFICSKNNCIFLVMLKLMKKISVLTTKDITKEYHIPVMMVYWDFLIGPH